MKCLLFAILPMVLAAPNPYELYTHDGDFASCLSLSEFQEIWHIFDLDHDGTVTHLEFDTAYDQNGFEHREQADRLFLELDRVADETLTDADFAHVFKLFDVDASGCVTSDEFHRMWTALTH